MTDKPLDMLIVGGGIAGFACALLLARQGFSVQLVDKNMGRPSLPDFSALPLMQTPRVSAITAASVEFFKQLGIWETLQASGRLAPFRRISVWDGASAASAFGVHFDSGAIGKPLLGYIIENALIQQVLYDAAHDAAHEMCLNLKQGVLQSIKQDQQFMAVTLNSGEVLRARLLIGADGALSQVRTLVGMNFACHDYDAAALVAMIRTELPHNNTARQCFLPSGPLGVLPLDHPHYCSIVWSGSQAMMQEYVNGNGNDSPEFLNEKLQKAFGDILGKLEVVSARHLFPLAERHATQYVLPRVALVGDAAHTVHPMAGQGINLGLQDVFCLADTLTAARQKQQDSGDYQVLRRYERARKSENALMLNVIHELYYGFGSQQSWLAALRRRGLHWTENCQPLKNLLMRHAMGL